MHVNTVKLCQFKTKDQETKPYPLCLGNYSKNFTFNNTQKNKTTEKKQKTKQNKNKTKKQKSKTGLKEV